MENEIIVRYPEVRTMQADDFWFWFLYMVLMGVVYETIRRLRIKYKHIDDIRFDERTNQITRQSLSVSWFLTFMAVGTLAFTSIFRQELLTVRLVITVVSGTMLGSYIVANYYYNKKGDVIR
ncbi:MAG: hypothetical protein ACT6FF_02955 [Methanosarcinaceae archaeon]